MSKTETITCPSGLQGEIRSLTIAEGNILANQKLVQQNKIVDELLKRCWLNTSASGLAGYNVTGAFPDWGKVLTGDRMYAFISIRVLTMGKDYEFRVRCEDPMCRTTLMRSVDLTTLQIKKLSNEAADIFAKGNSFTGKMPDGRSFTYRLTTGDDERRVSKELAENSDDKLVVSLLSRIRNIDGIDKDQKRSYIASLDYTDMYDILEQLEQHDCGVETEIEIDCSCGNEMRIELPFGEGFLGRRPKKKETNQEDS